MTIMNMIIMKSQMNAQSAWIMPKKNQIAALLIVTRSVPDHVDHWV